MSDSSKCDINQKTISKLVMALVVMACMQLSGCADTQYQERSDGPQSMGGQGQGRGSGMGGGPPSGGMNDRNTAEKEQILPDEAFTACEGKLSGDSVILIIGDEKVKATCKDINDHLVAIPDTTDENGNDRPRRQ